MVEGVAQNHPKQSKTIVFPMTNDDATNNFMSIERILDVEPTICLCVSEYGGFTIQNGNFIGKIMMNNHIFG
jgi:hypothetical protein